jgi:cytochrome c oxidase subunit 2
VAAARVIRVTAKKFEFEPSVITVKKGELVELELSTSDRRHGFDAPGLGIHAEIKPGTSTRVQLKPDKAGHFPFHCNVFCGDGHEEMTGEIVVTE